jgi:hypothetical protein
VSEETDTEAFMAQLERRIERKGWASVATWDDSGLPVWEYTTGFEETLDHPELVVGGLEFYTAHLVIDPLYHAIRRGEFTAGDGLEWEAVGRPRLVFRAVHPARLSPAYFSIAMYRRQQRGLAPHDLRILQLVLPDDAGKLPWEAGFDPLRRLESPEFGRPPDHAAPGGLRSRGARR